MAPAVDGVVLPAEPASGRPLRAPLAPPLLSAPGASGGREVCAVSFVPDGALLARGEVALVGLAVYDFLGGAVIAARDTPRVVGVFCGTVAAAPVAAMVLAAVPVRTARCATPSDTLRGTAGHETSVRVAEHARRHCAS